MQSHKFTVLWHIMGSWVCDKKEFWKIPRIEISFTYMRFTHNTKDSLGCLENASLIRVNHPGNTLLLLAWLAIIARDTPQYMQIHIQPIDLGNWCRQLLFCRYNTTQTERKIPVSYLIDLQESICSKAQPPWHPTPPSLSKLSTRLLKN
jgi:hypothetical protein